MLQKIQTIHEGEMAVQVDGKCPEEQIRDLAAVIAALYVQTSHDFKPAHADRLWSAWRWKNRIPQQWNYSGLSHAFTGHQD